MAEQLTLAGTWEPIAPVDSIANRPLAPLSPPDSQDPRQAWLFDGPHSLRQAAERACDQLDAAALRLAWKQADERYPTWPGARSWPLWALGIDHLLGHLPGSGAQATAPIRAIELAQRALSMEGAEVDWRFPGMSAACVHRVRSAALCQAATRLFAEEGAAARLQDGRPVGILHLVAGVPEAAVISLQLQAQTLAQAGDKAGQGRVLGYLGEALWRCERVGEALAIYRDAYLADPGAVDEKEMTCRPVMDLLDACADLEPPDDPRGWLPVLADLLQRVPLPASATPAPKGASAARTAAALLAAYRQRYAQANEAQRIERKRELLKCAPFLKEHVRRL